MYLEVRHGSIVCSGLEVIHLGILLELGHAKEGCDHFDWAYALAGMVFPWHHTYGILLLATTN